MSGAPTVLVVYESMFGNTRAVARAIASGLSEAMTAEVLDVGSMPAVLGYELVVAGGPTHDFTLSRVTTRQDAFLEGAEALPDVGLREWLTSLPKCHDGPRFATFDTRAGGIPGSAGRKAARILRSRGYEVVDTASYWVLGTHGPLVFGELEDARTWGRRLAASTSGAAAAPAP